MSEIEKQFMEVFGIEPRYEDACTVEDKYWANEELANEYGTFDQYMNYKCGNQENCTTECSCAYQKEIYPQITDHILLELIRLGLNYDFVIHAKSKDELKEKLLTLLIRNDVEFKHQVQAIFKENN